MIESYLTHEKVIQGEPALDEYLRATQVDFDDIKQEAFSDLLKDLIDQNLKIKRLCVPLSLQASVTKTASFDGVLSSQDYAQRLRLVIKVTALTGNAVFTLQGTDDEGATYNSIDLIDNENVSTSTITITSTGTYSYSLSGIYDKYRIQLISIGTTVTYSGYLIEEQYTTLHRELTRAKIYGSLMANQGDVWEGKYKYYMQSYENMLSVTKMTYDGNEDESIDEDEGDNNLNQNIRFRP